MSRGWRCRPGVSHDLKAGLRRRIPKSFRFYLRLHKGIEPRLADLRHNERRAVGRSFLVNCNYYLVPKVAAEVFDLVKNILQLRSTPFLLLSPPVSKSSALLQAVLEQPVRLADGVREIGNGCVDHSVVRNERQKIRAVTEPGPRNGGNLFLQDGEISEQREIFRGVAAPCDLVLYWYFRDCRTRRCLLSGSQVGAVIAEICMNRSEE